MNKRIKTCQYTLPAYLAPYLINGDASGLEDDEQEEIDTYLKQEEEQGNCYIEFTDCSEEPEFLRGNDLNNLGGDCLEYTAIITKKEQSQ